ncbi:hypothetical protein J6590_065331 [Homalodisca vitripennis]|nr:hypothetical protein J6590_065331 [Homalodisca vitripennis]
MDSTKTNLVAICNEKHSGDHPVKMRTLSPSPLITSPGNILTIDVLKRSTASSARPKMHLKTKDGLVSRIIELTGRQAGLVDKIQELKTLEEAKVELNRHRVVNVQTLAKSSVFKCDSSIQTEFKSSDKISTDRKRRELCSMQNTTRGSRKNNFHYRTGVLAAKENLKYPEFLEIKYRFTVLSEVEEIEFFPSNLQRRSSIGKNYSNKNTIQTSVGLGSGSIRHESRSYGSSKKNTIELVDVYGDSHAKNFKNKLCKHLNRRLASTRGDKDAVVIMAGSNDVSTINENRRSPGNSVVEQLTRFVKRKKFKFRSGKFISPT